MSESPETDNAPSPSRPSNGWFLTAFGFATIVAMFSMPFLAGEPKSDEVSQWVSYLGRFHFVILHLPIGMLSLVILMELGKLFRKDKGSSTLVPMFFTAASAVVAVIAGFLLYQSGDDTSDLIQDHMWWGIGFASCAVAAFIVKNWVDLSGGKGSFFYLLTLLGSAGVMGVASHDGGESVHGKGYLRKEEPPQVRQWVNQLPGAKQLPIEGGEEEVPKEPDQKVEEPSNATVEPPAVPTPVSAEEQVIFTHLVQPIFEAKCVSCHGEDKQKGKLRMDSYEALLAGGKEGEGFEPGNAKDSNILYRIHLPLEDDEHMPPEDKEQVEAHELAIIEWWINTGASPDAKVSDVEMPDAVKDAIGKIGPAESPEVSEAKEEARVEEANKEGEAKKLIAQKLEKLRDEFPSALNFESQNSSAVTFTAVSMRSNFTDQELAKLAPVMEAMVSLDLSSTKVSDKGVEVIGKAPNLKVLRLPETGITDASLDLLAGLSELESLNLYGTQVTTAGVAKLVTLPNLKRLYLWQTQVDEAGAEELRKKMPGCEIVMGL